jgi:hypothetical protein
MNQFSKHIKQRILANTGFYYQIIVEPIKCELILKINLIQCNLIKLKVMHFKRIIPNKVLKYGTSSRCALLFISKHKNSIFFNFRNEFYVRF